MTVTNRHKLSHQEVVFGLLLGLTHKQIADRYGVARETVSRLAAEPEVKAEVERSEAEIVEAGIAVLKSNAQMAARKMAELVHNDDPRIALDAAKSLLSKAGADAPTKSEQKAAVEVKTEERVASLDELEAKLKALRALRAEEGK